MKTVNSTEIQSANAEHNSATTEFRVTSEQLNLKFSQFEFTRAADSTDLKDSGDQ